jgi:hypothetical protein
MRSTASGVGLTMAMSWLAFSVSSLAPSVVAQPQGGGVEILSVATEKCLDVADASTASGASVNQVRCHGNANQRWIASPASVPGYVSFSSQNSRLCLDVRLGGPADGTLQQFTCHYGDNQLFRLEPIDGASGAVRIVARHSGKCLDVPGGQAVAGLAIQQWDCHTGSNQRWLYAEPGRYRYQLIVGPITRLDFILREGRAYLFEMRDIPAGGAPVLHLWSDEWGHVAFNTGPAGPGLSSISYTVPAGKGGVHRLFAFARPGTAPGAGTLTVLQDGALYQTRQNAPFGGAVVNPLSSTLLQRYRYETTLVPGGITDSYLLAFDRNGRMIGHDDDGGIGRAAALSGLIDVATLVVGAIDGTGAVALYVNDAFRDRDGDGLGYGLERELGTCDVRGSRALCREVHNLQDTDRDGLTDAAEAMGIDGAQPMLLPRWGAIAVRKDVFVEIDYTSRYARMPITEADAEAIRDYFSVGPAADVRNPNGTGGIAIHLDVGFDPRNPSNRTLFGNWGGSNLIPQDHPDKPSFRRPERRNVFFHGILHTGGQGIGSDGFGFSLLNTTGNCQSGITAVPGNARKNVQVFVHELGHALNLEHEGGSGASPLGLNCSVIYPSIMNYAAGTWGPVGFAMGDEYPGLTLNPARLCEADGLGSGDLAHLSKFGLSTQGSAIDWNGDGVIQSCDRPVRARVNWFAPSGCGTHVQGIHGQDDGTLARGGSPSLARLGSYLYLFYVDETGGLKYVRGKQGTQWPTSGCPHGFAGRGDAPCTDWSSPTDTPETAPINTVRAIGVDGRMYVTYTDTRSDAISALIAEGARDDGHLIFWRPKQTIPGSRATAAPALGVLYEQGFQGRVSRLLVALWPNSQTYRLEGAHVDLARTPTALLRRAAQQDGSGGPIVTNGAPVTLAFWGRDDGRSVATNQTWLALADSASRISIYRYDPAATRWRDMTASVFPVRPSGEVDVRIGFAYRPLVDADGKPLDPLKGEFTLAYGARNEGGVGSIWISDVVEPTRPPDQALSFPQSLAGRVGHPWYGVDLGYRGGVDLFSDPGLPYLKGAIARPDGRISFLAYADGVFDRAFRTGSDFQVMERGICLRLHDRDDQFCGPPNVFGY